MIILKWILFQVTVERDLQIRRTFKEVPLLWTLLELTAWYRPSLATCSVLLRAIAATVIANWNLSEGVALTNVMALGQLLPPPLASIRDVLPTLDPTQVWRKTSLDPSIKNHFFSKKTVLNVTL